MSSYTDFVAQRRNLLKRAVERASQFADFALPTTQDWISTRNDIDPITTALIFDLTQAIDFASGVCEIAIVAFDGSKIAITNDIAGDGIALEQSFTAHTQDRVRERYTHFGLGQDFSSVLIWRPETGPNSTFGTGSVGIPLASLFDEFETKLFARLSRRK